VECAFGILVEKRGILRRPISSNLEHNIMVAYVFMILHNFGVDNSITSLKPQGSDLVIMVVYSWFLKSLMYTMHLKILMLR